MVSSGFTLAELLISLAILGVIATFTIPKVLNAQSTQQSNAIAKEVAGMVSGAYQSYQIENGAPASTTLSDLTPFMNYVAVDSTTVIDNVNNAFSQNCSIATETCLRLHSGAIIRFTSATSFNTGDTTQALRFLLDPDGEYGGSLTGPSKSVAFFIYRNGKLRTRGSVDPGTYVGTFGPYVPNATVDPEWFSWD